MKVHHGEWTIASHPQKAGHRWHSCCDVERPPSKDEAGGQIFNFSDIACFDTEAAAHVRAIAWAKAWINENV
jgi:hypothetical protein